MPDRPIAAMDFIDAAKATTPDATLLRDAGVELRGERCVTEEDVIRVAAEADVLLDGMGPITRRVLSSLSNCKVVVRYGVGVDNVDLDAATDEGITVVNVPDYCVEEVSNHVITFLLAWAKQLAPLDACVRSGEWAERKRWPMDKVQSVHQQTLGVIGAGRIGLAAARKAKALAMEVLVYDPYIDEQRLTGEGLTPAGLDRVLAESDYVSVHTPLTDETRHLIGREALGAMKETAFLINVSRGPIVDEAALIAALEAGEIAGAALDVFETEPIGPDNPLCKMQNTILTPHAAHYSPLATIRARTQIAEEVLRALGGEWPLNVANPAVKQRSRLGFAP